MYDENVSNYFKSLKPSERGEYEITDLINIYINQDKCSNIELSSWWIDAGTPEAIKNIEIVNALELPPIKIHCSVLAEDSIKQAIEDYEAKQ